MKSFRHFSLLIAALAFSGACVYAQSSASELLQQSERTRTLSANERQNLEKKTVPQLYEGELEDLGPQLLLLEKVKRKLFEVYVDFQLYRSSNATLSEMHTSTDVFVGTAQMAYLFKPTKFQGGDVNTRIGVRFQSFMYGTLGNDDTPILPGTAPVDSLDFFSRSAFADLAWTRGMWRVTAGLTYTSLVGAHGNEQNFYYEWVPAWSIGRLHPINDNWTAFYLYDGALHLSTTLTQRAFNGDDDVDRKIDNALSAIFTRKLGERLSFQPSARLQVSEYLANNRARTDYIASLVATIQYQITEEVSGRIFTSYDARESDEPATADYRNNNVGLGVSGYVKF